MDIAKSQGLTFPKVQINSPLIIITIKPVVISELLLKRFDNRIYNNGPKRKNTAFRAK